MESALYCPVYGYYEKEADTVGRGGDYYTSVSVGPLFGELLALQYSLWLEPLVLASSFPSAGPSPPGYPGEPAAIANRRVSASQFPGGAGDRRFPLQLVEAGAHNGDLAKDILLWLREHRPAVFDQIEFVVIEPSSTREQWQRRTLVGFEGKVRWVRSLEQLGPVQGILFSNELLDAFPIHRFEWDSSRKEWFERGVGLDKERFCWVKMELARRPLSSAVQPPQWSAQILERLPNGFVVEVCPSAAEWWNQAARALIRGKLITIDYGLASNERLAPERAGGTLRSYRNHAVTSDVLADPGDQDLTAHVDFTTLAQMGEAAGLSTEGLFTQEGFLTRIASLVFRGEQEFGAWTSQRTRKFGTLTHPSHLGHAFRVLVQSR
jgi:SAM-dependent MidA family methyltransferase